MDICGDGIKVKADTIECDDGNLVDGDGCNYKCQTEAGFQCKGGTPTSPDVCANKVAPVASAKTFIARPNIIKIYFTKEVKTEKSEILSSIIDCRIEGFTSEEFTYLITQESDRMWKIHL